MRQVLSPEWMGMTERQMNMEILRRIDTLPKDRFARWACIPFHIAEGCWDVADSVIDIAIRMRLDPTKPLSRSIRELRRSYERKRQRDASDESVSYSDLQKYSLENYLDFESRSKDEIRSLYDCVRRTIERDYPNLDEDFVELFGAVCHCRYLIKAVCLYTDRQKARIQKELRLPRLWDILPSELRSLDQLLVQFCGDKRLRIDSAEDSAITESIIAKIEDIQIYRHKTTRITKDKNAKTMYFETKVRYQKQADNGSVKKVTESYLVDALSFTEAEARTIQEREPFISGEFSVNAARKTKIAEIIRSDDQENPDNKWWLVKWVITTVDETHAAMGKPATEKKVVTLSLVEAPYINDAYNNFMTAMRNTLADFDIVGITESPILEVYMCEPA